VNHIPYDQGIIEKTIFEVSSYFGKGGPAGSHFTLAYLAAREAKCAPVGLGLLSKWILQLSVFKKERTFCPSPIYWYGG